MGSPMANYLFDVKLWAAVRLDAPDEATARATLNRLLDCAMVTVTAEQGLESLTFEASTEGEADLVEVDGQAAE